MPLLELIDMIRRILIVEPDLEVARDIFLLFQLERGRFESERYEPEIAGSVAEAVEQAQAVNFHCIIMDVELPEMKGYEAVPLIKTINNKLPIIITAGKNSIEVETKVREQDVYYYHIRSFGLDELKLAVGSVFDELGKLEKVEKLHKVVAKPILLKRLRSSENQEKQDVVITGGHKSNIDYG
jgi:CheY-like chemotaxis protein